MFAPSRFISAFVQIPLVLLNTNKKFAALFTIVVGASKCFGPSNEGSKSDFEWCWIKSGDCFNWYWAYVLWYVIIFAFHLKCNKPQAFLPLGLLCGAVF
jgi:hypothetical protein